MKTLFKALTITAVSFCLAAAAQQPKTFASAADVQALLIRGRTNHHRWMRRQFKLHSRHVYCPANLS